MPICPRCGKSLSSDQALTYHLNRKYKCGTWKCPICSLNFDTKFSLKIHQQTCGSARHYILPSYDLLWNIYVNSKLLILEVDNDDIIHNVSPNCELHFGNKQQTVIGKRSSEFLNDGHRVFQCLPMNNTTMYIYT